MNINGDLNGKNTIKSGPYSAKSPEWNWSTFERFRLKLNSLNKTQQSAYIEKIFSVEDVLINDVKQLLSKYNNSQSKEYNSAARNITSKAWNLMNDIYNMY